MTTQNRSNSPVDAVAEALLRDVAFALRMSRLISNEIRKGQRTSTEPKVVRLTDASAAVTLGA